MGFLGDLWQFRPVRLTAIFDDPFQNNYSSATRSMLAMFWARGPDSFQEFMELTKANRCKDEWLGTVPKRARHGNMEHELHCFMHGLPTKHAGSWMPSTSEVRCKQASCQALCSKWYEKLLTSTPGECQNVKQKLSLIHI